MRFLIVLLESLLVCAVYSCKKVTKNDKFSIMLDIKTSDCYFAGTDTYLEVYFPDANKTQNHKFKPNIGPFSLKSASSKFGRNETDHITIPWLLLNEQFSAKNETMCLPDPHLLIIRRRRYNYIVPELMSGWKPHSISVKIKDHHQNDTTNRFEHQLPADCAAGWVDDAGYYQIGPADGQIQYLGNDFDTVFDA